MGRSPYAGVRGQEGGGSSGVLRGLLCDVRRTGHMGPTLYRIQSANKLKIPAKDVVAATIIFKTCQKREISIFFLSCVV